MATAIDTSKTRSLEGEQRVVLPAVGWEGYETLLRMVGDGHVRLTYDSGDVELMSPSHNHEFYKKVLGWMIETVADELDIPYQTAGSTTWRKKADDRGLEADDCYYLANLDLVRAKRNKLDLTIDPPPDLAVEIEITQSALDRLGIYAALGVREVWRFDGERLRIEQLQADVTFATVPRSLGLPEMMPDEVARWIAHAEAIANRVVFNRQFRAWVRVELVPRRQGN